MRRSYLKQDILSRESVPQQIRRDGMHADFLASIRFDARVRKQEGKTVSSRRSQAVLIPGGADSIPENMQRTDKAAQRSFLQELILIQLLTAKELLLWSE